MAEAPKTPRIEAKAIRRKRRMNPPSEGLRTHDEKDPLGERYLEVQRPSLICAHTVYWLWDASRLAASLHDEVTPIGQSLP